MSVPVFFLLVKNENSMVLSFSLSKRRIDRDW